MAESFLFHNAESVFFFLAGIGTMKASIVFSTLVLFGLGF